MRRVRENRELWLLGILFLLLVGMEKFAYPAGQSRAYGSIGRDAPRGGQSPWSPQRMEQVEIWLKTQPAYSHGSAMPVTVMVGNRATKPVLVNKRMLVNHPGLPGDVYFEVLSASGEPIPFKALVTPRPPSEGEFIELKPGQSIERTLNLSEWHKVTRPGPYQIRVTYRNDVDLVKHGVRAWKGVVTSEVAKIQVR